MAAAMNKRQTARNERALQDLLKQPGNDRCADCFARNPGWASWNLGIFLCVRCASLHRKLGTHISKVKSLKMDTWTADQVENMKRVGNTASNRAYNPKQKKANIPIDADEVDSAMERFVRDKYQHKSLATDSRTLPSRPAQATGGSDSSSDIPPPLPPKNTPSMGAPWRSKSSTYPTRTNLPSPPGTEWGSDVSGNGEGARRAHGMESSFDVKLNQLRDMGFANASRNLTILKGTGGDLDKAIATLTRLGEGYGNVLPRTRPHAQGDSASGQVTRSSNNQYAQPAGSVDRPQANSILPTQEPWEGTLSSQFQPSPFAENGLDAFGQSMQGLNISQPQALPGTQSAEQYSGKTTQTNPFLKSYNPPNNASNLPLQNGQYSQMAPSQPTTQMTPNVNSNNNPFLVMQASQGWQQQQQNTSQPLPQTSQQFLHSATPWSQGTPIQQSPTGYVGPTRSDSYFSPAAQSPYSQPPSAGFGGPQPYMVPSGPMPAGQGSLVEADPRSNPNPYFADPRQASTPFRSPGPMDKSSILALYNTSGLQGSPAPAAPHPWAPEPLPAAPQMQGPHRSATVPLVHNSNNPFANASTQGHASRDSILFTGNAYTGRSQSPDAFSGLSARAG